LAPINYPTLIAPRDQPGQVIRRARTADIQLFPRRTGPGFEVQIRSVQIDTVQEFVVISDILGPAVVLGAAVVKVGRVALGVESPHYLIRAFDVRLQAGACLRDFAFRFARGDVAGAQGLRRDRGRVAEGGRYESEKGDEGTGEGRHCRWESKGCFGVENRGE